MKFGAAQTRDEDGRLVRGAGCFVADRHIGGALWMHVLRADMAAGMIREIDTAAARDMPGVRLVLTGRDPEITCLRDTNVRYVPLGTEVRPNPVRPLALDRVRYMGEPLAVVVATSEATARDAAEAVWVDIDIEDAVVSPRDADDPKAPRLWPEGNRIFRQELGDRAAFEKALQDAAHQITARIEISTATAVSLETRGSCAVPEGDTLHLFTGTQAPHRVRAEAAHVFDMPEDRIRVVARDVGGSFGMRNGIYPEDVLVLAAARALGTPVRWRASRSDAFLSDALSRPQSVDVTLALDADLHFTALGLDGYAPVGAYVGAMAMHPMTSSLPALCGVYRTPVIHTVMRGLHVNTMHMAPYRGAGRPEAIFVIERIIDIAAHRLGIDRVALRRQNMITPDQMPHATPLGFVYDSGDFPAALDKALDRAGWNTFEARRQQARARGKLRGIGLSCAIESAGAGTAAQQLPEFGAFSLGADGVLQIAAGSGDSGQGHATVFAQMAELLLGWSGPVEIVRGDTERVPQGIGTFGSRTMGAAGQALSDAAQKVIAAAMDDAALALDAAGDDLVFEDGAFRIPGSNRFVTLQDLAKKTGKAYEGDTFSSAKAGTFPNSVHIAEVEIDPETGQLDLLNYVAVDDVGRVVNPLLLDGQLHGGIAQGLGQAFMERIVHDTTGAMQSGSLMDYAVPRADDFPMFTLEHQPTPTNANALGVKGAGESGVVGSLACGISAVHDALKDHGVEDVPMPASPHRIWQALQNARSISGDLS